MVVQFVLHWEHNHIYIIAAEKRAGNNDTNDPRQWPTIAGHNPAWLTQLNKSSRLLKPQTRPENKVHVLNKR